MHLTFLKKVKKLKLKTCISNQLLISSLISMGIISPTKLISQPFIKPKIQEVNIYSKKSFITKAVERTGSSVVTIDTQRFVKKRIYGSN